MYMFCFCLFLPIDSASFMGSCSAGLLPIWLADHGLKTDLTQETTIVRRFQLAEGSG